LKWIQQTKRLYQKALDFSNHRFSALILFCLISLRGFFIFSIPTDVAFMTLCLGNPKRGVLIFAPVSLGASLFGGFIGYLIGYFISEPLKNWLISIGLMSQIQWDFVLKYITDYGVWAVALGVLTPVPYQFFTMGSGIFHLPVFTFLLAIFISRGLKFYLQSWLVFHYGQQIKIQIDRYFHVLVYLLGAGLIFLLGYQIL